MHWKLKKKVQMEKLKKNWQWSTSPKIQNGGLDVSEIMASLVLIYPGPFSPNFWITHCALVIWSNKCKKRVKITNNSGSFRSFAHPSHFLSQQSAELVTYWIPKTWISGFGNAIWANQFRASRTMKKKLSSFFAKFLAYLMISQSGRHPIALWNFEKSSNISEILQ